VFADYFREAGGRGKSVDEIRKKLASLSKEELARLTKKTRANPSKAEHRLIRPQTRVGEPLPLSFAQQRIWFHQRLVPDSTAYHLSMGLTLKGPLAREVLQQSLDEIIRRHQTLRTTFHLVEGEPVQIVAPPEAGKLSFSDVSHYPPEEQEVYARKLAEREITAPFDLMEGPLYRCRLLRLNDQEHLLIIVVHHIVADGWSMELFKKELAVHYEAIRADKESLSLPELPVQYGDYAKWQHDSLHHGELKEQLEGWKRHLADAPAVLEIPTDRPRPPVLSHQGGREIFRWDLPLAQALRDLSAKEGTTLYMTLFAAFLVWVHHYTGREDLVIGSPVANRMRSEVESLIGMFVNLLILRIDASGDPTFRELLKRVKRASLQAYQSQDVPFEKIVESLARERDTSRNPLVQVMFQFQNTPSAEIDAASLKWENTELPAEGTPFEVLFSVNERVGGLGGMVKYSTDLYRPETVKQWITHYHTVVRNIVANPDRRISAIPCLPVGEKEQMLVRWNDTASDYPRERCVHQLIEEQVKKTPDRIAVRWGEEQLSYRMLNERANRLAHHLRRHGVGPDCAVGICVERAPEMLIGLLAIWKAGGAYVPLDPSYPSERLAYMIRHAKLAILLTQSHLFPRLPVEGVTVHCLDQMAPWTGPTPSDESPLFPLFPHPDQLAYLIYTSGSTGKPKGIGIPHRAVVNFLSSMKEKPGLTASDRLLALTTLSFDIAGLELYLPLITGASTLLASRETALDGKRLVETIATWDVTCVQATPVTWRMMVESGWVGDSALTMLCGGEALPRTLAQALDRKGKALWNLYGPTECTIWSTIAPVDESESEDPVSIGRPIRNTQTYVLNQKGNPVPISVPGALTIGGEGLARGYWQNPRQTAEQFVPNPFSDQPGARMYGTGDLACYRFDGSLRFMGRLDRQVKVRGYRIETAEIEAVLQMHPDIHHSVVVLREDTPGDPRLAAYLITTGSRRISVSDIRSFLMQKLPGYMIPAAFVTLDALPLTPNGKVDVRALPAPEARPHLNVQYERPQSQTEQRLEQIWREKLRLDHVGVQDHFFELGGNSMLLTSIHALIAQEWETDLSLVEMFQYPTIRALAARLTRDGEAHVQPHLASGQSRGQTRRELQAVRRTLRSRRQQGGPQGKGGGS
jgi:amino acid adenylation domain-containing protein